MLPGGIRELMRIIRKFFVSTVLLLLVASCPRTDFADPLPNLSADHLIRFVHLSDTQIVDEESPARSIRFAPLTHSAWRPQEAYGIHTLDATLRVINDRAANLGDGESPIDFIIATGDQTDGCQGNELRWFIDTMDGGNILTDSGAPDGEDRIQPDENNPKLVYDAEGLSPEIPWFTVYGNHDALASGVFAIDRSDANPANWTAPLLRPYAALIGLHGLFPPRNEFESTADVSPAAITAAVEPADPETMALKILSVLPGPIVPDPDRQFSSRQQFIDEHFTTTTFPKGHGFTYANRQSGLARYSMRPVGDVPVRLIVLDTVIPDPVPGFPAQYGVMTREQFDAFLKPELENALKSDELVLIASHHPSSNFDLPYHGSRVGTEEFRAYLASQPHVIAHLCGHGHRHSVEKIGDASPYFEIQTASIIDYPQESRILDISYNESTGEIGLKSEIISHMDNPTDFSAESFRRASIQAESLGKSEASAEVEALKAELEAAGFATWPEPSQGDLKNYGEETDRDFEFRIKKHGLKSQKSNARDR